MGLTLKEYAKAYAFTIYGPVNAWGQCVHPTLGVSNNILREMYRIFGEDASELAINDEIISLNKKVT
jgi:hypothetical protein